jgi:uncharacterized protein GlcG (DUF336 family)
VPNDAYPSHPEVSLATAHALVHAACEEAERQGLAVSVVVGDRSGELVAAARMDGAPLGSLRLAADKAYTAAVWRMPSGDLRLSSQPGGDDWGITSTADGRIVVYDGGLPLLVDGDLAGCIGVSGGTGQQDVACAQAAIASLPSSP